MKTVRTNIVSFEDVVGLLSQEEDVSLKLEEKENFECTWRKING